MLEDHADLLAQPAQCRAAQTGDLATFDEHFTGAGALEQVEDSQEGAFTGAGATDDAEDLASLHGEAHVAQGEEWAVGGMEVLVDLAYFDHCWRGSCKRSVSHGGCGGNKYGEFMSTQLGIMKDEAMVVAPGWERRSGGGERGGNDCRAEVATAVATPGGGVANVGRRNSDSRGDPGGGRPTLGGSGGDERRRRQWGAATRGGRRTRRQQLGSWTDGNRNRSESVYGHTESHYRRDSAGC